jgi:hypothetical protein
MREYEDVSVLVGRVVERINYNGSDEIRFLMEDGAEYLMFHSQDCCENVQVEDMEGDFNDLIGSPVLIAEESSGETPADYEFEYGEPESYTWTFYKFSTIKGSVTLRWLGTSNGYYGERVSFVKV